MEFKSINRRYLDGEITIGQAENYRIGINVLVMIILSIWLIVCFVSKPHTWNIVKGVFYG